MTISGLHKLAENGATLPELKQLCEKMLRGYGVPLITLELVSILKSDYGKDVTPYRLANVLKDDTNIFRAKYYQIPEHIAKPLKGLHGVIYNKKWWYWI